MAEMHGQPPSIFSVALIQLNPKPLDPEFNFNEATKHIRAASAQGALLAVLPEYHLTSWEPEDPGFLIAVMSGQRYVEKYQDLARELGINIVPGTIITTYNSLAPTISVNDPSVHTASSPVLLNKTYFISATGDIAGEYTKTNLWHPERKYLTSGPAAQGLLARTYSPPHALIHTPLGPIGLLICYDLAFPEAFRSLVKSGARIIIIPTFTKETDMSADGLAYNPNAESLFLQSALISRAFENTCCIVFCNAGGPPGDGYVGLSQITMPIVGRLRGSFDGPLPGMRIISVDTKVLDVAEDNYKIRQDISQVDFHY